MQDKHTRVGQGSALAACLMAAFSAGPAHATNGYFEHGYGIKSQGIGGVGIALPQDGLAAAANPAGTAFVGNRVDAGLSWFVPKRGADIVGNAAPSTAVTTATARSISSFPNSVPSGRSARTWPPASPSTAMAA